MPLERTGESRRGVVRVGTWRPATSRAFKLREYLLHPGFGGTDYGLTDAQLTAYLNAAERERGGLRLSVHALAREQIERDQGVRPTRAEDRATAARNLAAIARAESGHLPPASPSYGLWQIT